MFAYFIVRQRWRREEEETRLMYQFVENIQNEDSGLVYNWNVRTLPGKDCLSKTAKAEHQTRGKYNTTRDSAIIVFGSRPKIYRPHINIENTACIMERRTANLRRRTSEANRFFLPRQESIVTPIMQSSRDN